MARLYNERLENPKSLQLPSNRGISGALCCWIDEIEAVISIREGGTQSRVFASFLTWMQEKSAFVFIAATANILPPEVLRKGRFDQILFVTLPNAQERKSIFSIHLKKNSAELSLINLDMLVKLKLRVLTVPKLSRRLAEQ